MTTQDTPPAGGQRPAQFTQFSRGEWAALRASTPLQLTEDDLAAVRGINERLSLEDAAEVYLPLTRLLNLQVTATQQLRRVTDTFLGSPAAPAPFVIGLAGSVAVGKSTAARLLQTLLARWPEHPRVALVTTDGFLYPNAVLEQQGLMTRKGFPESYDRSRLLQFVRDVKDGKPHVSAPVYSHLIYNIAPGEAQIVDRPDILILEGLNVLQRGLEPETTGRRFVSDYFDFSIYIDAEEDDIRQWFLNRFLKLRETAFLDEQSYFRHYARMPEDDALEIARGIWERINGKNLRENIAPTREMANLVLRKGPDHGVTEVRLRRS
ncbi:pantothenate kinase [Capsulimonas corticalis]|uniref:Pantothenate kinase n=1 Tax=Capsulimonas corticalis TaxID=2219043 RepID=A0A402CQU3_9BACT|nr:type I pantothenate kinase [Capsulimonas corticalis]BDI34395.1 pantothenate kinase [Capsulimonas corticalis]